MAGIAILMAVAGIATKMATGWWAAKRAHISVAGRLRAGVALLPRGEFNIVIAGLAVAAGINPQLGPLAAAYVLMLAVLGPLFARGVEPLINRISRRHPATPAAASAGTDPVHLPAQPSTTDPDTTPAKA